MHGAQKIDPPKAQVKLRYSSSNNIILNHQKQKRVKQFSPQLPYSPLEGESIFIYNNNSQLPTHNPYNRPSYQSTNNSSINNQTNLQSYCNHSSQIMKKNQHFFSSNTSHLLKQQPLAITKDQNKLKQATSNRQSKSIINFSATNHNPNLPFKNKGNEKIKAIRPSIQLDLSNNSNVIYQNGYQGTRYIKSPPNSMPNSHKNFQIPTSIETKNSIQNYIENSRRLTPRNSYSSTPNTQVINQLTHQAKNITPLIATPQKSSSSSNIISKKSTKKIIKEEFIIPKMNNIKKSQNFSHQPLLNLKPVGTYQILQNYIPSPPANRTDYSSQCKQKQLTKHPYLGDQRNPLNSQISRNLLTKSDSVLKPKTIDISHQDSQTAGTGIQISKKKPPKAIRLIDKNNLLLESQQQQKRPSSSIGVTKKYLSTVNNKLKHSTKKMQDIHQEKQIEGNEEQFSEIS